MLSVMQKRNAYLTGAVDFPMIARFFVIWYSDRLSSHNFALNVDRGHGQTTSAFPYFTTRHSVQSAPL